MTPRRRLARARSGVLAALAVLMLGACGAGTATPALTGPPGGVPASPAAPTASPTASPTGSRHIDIESDPWPTAGEVRAALTAEYGYQFTEWAGSRSRYKDPTGAFFIDVPSRDNYTADAAVSVYKGSYEDFLTDFDNVFAVIVPEARPWEREMLQLAGQTDSAQRQVVTSGGSILFNWDSSLPILSFAFSANPLPRP